MNGDNEQRAFDYLNTLLSAPDETLAWKGRPDPRRVVGLDRASSIVIGAVVLLFATIWIASIIWVGITLSGLSTSGLLLLGCMGPVFGAIGLWMITTPARNRAQVRRLFYAVTSRRIIIVNAHPKGYSATIIFPEMLKPIELTEHADGTADVELTATGGLNSVLWGVENPKLAHEAIKHLLRP